MVNPPDGQRVIVPAGTARGVRVDVGGLLVVENVSGGQVGDLFVFDDISGEHLSAAHTRSCTGRLFPRRGESFVTNRRRPILTLIADTSPGLHDMLIPACDPVRYELLGASGHGNCSENLRLALSNLGLAPCEPPQPVNLFMSVEVDSDGALQLAPSPANAGDRVTLRAERRVVAVLSACPQDLIDINAGAPSDLALEVDERAHRPRS